MKLRNDSPFAVLSEQEQMMVLEMSESLNWEQMVNCVEKMGPGGLEFSIPALKRFVARLKEESLREEVEDADEAMEGMAKAGRSGRARDGVLEAMRRKMFSEAMESKNSGMAMMVFKMMKEEQKEDRSLALEERRQALEEDNAKQEWRLKELEGARSALRLLPALAEILNGGEGTAEERLARARECLGAGGAKLLLAETGK